MKILLWSVCCIAAITSSVSIKLSTKVHSLELQNEILNRKIKIYEKNQQLMHQYQTFIDTIKIIKTN